MTNFGILSLEAAKDGKLPEWIRILPLGKVELADNRAAFTVDAESLQKMVTAFRQRGIDLVIDYEHQSLNGERAPAAGWIKTLEARADGLWAKVDWTEQAKSYLAAKEYRYFSPVLRLDPKDRRPIALMHVGLTNVPAINNLPPLVAKLAAKYGDGEVQTFRDFTAEERKKGVQEGWAMPDGSFPIKSREDVQNAIKAIGRAQDPEAVKKHISTRAKALNCMDLLPAGWPGSTKKMEEAQAMKKKVLEVFGGVLALKAEATDEEVLAALKTGLALAGAVPEIVQVLALKEDAGPAEIIGAIKGLKASSDRLTQVEETLAALKTKLSQGKAKKAVADALAAHKITPAQETWALKYAEEKPEEFAAFVANAPAQLPRENFKFKNKEGGETTLSEEEGLVCKSLGISFEAFKAEKDKQAAKV